MIIAGLTRVTAASQYERATSKALGKDVPVAGTYAPTEANPQGFIDVILADVIWLRVVIVNLPCCRKYPILGLRQRLAIRINI